MADAPKTAVDFFRVSARQQPAARSPTADIIQARGMTRGYPLNGPRVTRHHEIEQASAVRAPPVERDPRLILQTCSVPVQEIVLKFDELRPFLSACQHACGCYPDFGTFPEDLTCPSENAAALISIVVPSGKY
jgi:hypothetical protein